MKKIILNIEGMTCAGCSSGLEKYLNKQNGIKNAVVNLVMATATIEYEEFLTISDLERFVKEAGFKSLGEKQPEREKRSKEFKEILIFSLLGIILMYVSMGHMLNLPVPEFLNMMKNPIIYTSFLIVITTLFLIWGWDIIKNGIKNIVHKMPNMDSLVGVGVIVNFLKSNMSEIITNLKQMNKKVVMLTGDNTLTAKHIAKQLGIEEVYSNISPQGKLEKIKELNNNKNCLMVGDGINDSPALKTATIGISVANGTDISADSADIILLNENMELVSNLFNIGRKTIRIIKENLFWALFYNICMIPLATGLLPISLNPMIASLAMTLSSLSVVLNSLRLR